MADEEWNDLCLETDQCALGGSAAFFAGIPDAGVVVNGPHWCYFYALRYLERNTMENLNERFFCSQPDSQALVYGTEDCLKEILETVRDKPFKLLLLQNNCSVSLIGDDLAGIAGEMALPFPVITLDSGGLKGCFSAGYRLAAKAYLQSQTLPEYPVKKHAVNLLGCTLGYYNAANDLQELTRMLNLAGYEVIACFGAGSSTEEIKELRRAELNIVVNAELGLEAAQYLAKHYNMKYIAPLPPYGLAGSLDWLRLIAEEIGVSESGRSRAEEEFALLHKRLEKEIVELEMIWEPVWLEKTLISAPYSTALGLAAALRREWLDTGYLAVILQENEAFSLYEAEEADEILTRSAKDSDKLSRLLQNFREGLILGSSNDRLLQKDFTAVIYLNIALPVYDEINCIDQPFMGFRGALYLRQQIYNQYYRQKVRQLKIN